MKIIGIAVFLFVAVVGIAQEITPQRGVSFNATGILPAHDHSSPRNGAISGAAKLAIVNVGDQNTALTLDNTLDGTTRAPFIQFRKRTTAGTPAEVGAVLGQLTFDSSNSAGTSAEIRSSVQVQGSDAGARPAGAGLALMTAPGDTTAPAETRLFISATGTATFSGAVQAPSVFSTSFSSAPVLYGGVGSASAASFSYSGNVNTGMYFSGTDVRFAAGGGARGSVVTGIGICGGVGTTAGLACLRSSAGSDSDPGFQWASDPNTGMRWVANNNQALIVGGVRALDQFETLTSIYPGTVNTSTFSTTGYSLAVSSGLSVAGPVLMDSRTKAQFDALVGVVKQVFLCSDCIIPYSVCVGTGPTLSGWKVSHSATGGCGTNN